MCIRRVLGVPSPSVPFRSLQVTLLHLKRVRVRVLCSLHFTSGSGRSIRVESSRIELLSNRAISERLSFLNDGRVSFNLRVFLCVSAHYSSSWIMSILSVHLRCALFTVHCSLFSLLVQVLEDRAGHTGQCTAALQTDRTRAAHSEKVRASLAYGAFAFG